MALVTRGSPRATALALVLAGMALSCGEALVGEDYLGTPRFTIPGSVMGTSKYVGTEHPEVNVAVFWSLRGMSSEGVDLLAEQPGTSLRAEYYRSFELQVYDEPGPEHFMSLPSGARVGVAWLAAYQDTNGNRRKDDSEPLIGGSPGRVLIRAPEPLQDRDSPTGAALAAGWHFVSAPLSCKPPPPPDAPAPGGAVPVPDGECGVPLGASCRLDSDCGAGVCLRELGGPWPGGACAIPEPPLNGCRQKGSALLRSPDEPEMAYWVKGCQVTADCGRAAPYQCDQQFRGCRPSATILVELNDQGPPRTYCQPDGPQRSP